MAARSIKGKMHPNCNHTGHSAEVSYVIWNINQVNKYSHCQGDWLHGCMLKIKIESKRQMNRWRNWGRKIKNHYDSP